MSSNSPALHKAFDFAWGTFKEHFGMFTAYLFTFFIAWVILEIMVVAGQRLGLIFWVLAHLSFFIVFAGLEAGFIQICLALQAGKQISYADIFRELRLGIKFLFIQSVYFATVLIGLALLIAPGAYLGTKYTFYAFTTTGNSNLKQSFQKSAAISRASISFLFWFSILCILFNIVGASLLGIGLIITIPVSTLMKAFIYRQLSDNGGSRYV